MTTIVPLKTADPLTVVERPVVDAEITITNLRVMKQDVATAFFELEQAAAQYKEATRAFMDAVYGVLTRKDAAS